MHRLLSRWSAPAYLLALASLLPLQLVASASQEQDSPNAAPTFPAESEAASSEKSAQTQQEENGIELQADGKIRFKFVDAPWSEVIQFFAEQAEFSLQPIETEPEGTFKYHDDQAYTVMEALDQLNYALALRGFTLVRNKRLLVLVPTERNIPDDLIETVKPDELDERGKHEILKCIFDLEGLEDSQIEEQIESLISRNHNDAFHVIPSAKQMIVREKGQTLRTIREFMNKARNEGENRFVVDRHQLSHIDPESVFEAARVLLDLDANNQSPDGQFKVMVQPLSTELIFRGSTKKVQQFKDLLAQLDVATNSATTGSTERPYLKQYSISGDLDMAFKVIQTMMAGRDVKFDIDKSTSKALVLGRADDHKRMEEVLVVLASGGEGFAVIDLKHISTAKAMTILDQLYQRDLDSPEKGPVQGPVFFADETNSRLIVKGMPQEVAAVKSYLQQLDVEVVLNTGPRSTKRIIPMNGSSVTADFIGDLLSTTGRENRLQIYMPKDLKPRGSFEEYSIPQTAPVDEPPSKSSDEGDSKGSGMLRRLGNALIAMHFARTPSFSTALVTLQEPANSESDPQDDEPDEPKSVPGAVVEVKITEYGIVLTSEDLDALDEFESILRSQFEELSAMARPGVFYLKWRDPKSAKSILEKIIGLKSSSSSGSDPLSSLLGAGVNNMIPGMGDLFGGGGSSASAAGAVVEMESEVVILADEELRALIVAASQRDMDIIAPLITDFIDQPGAPHDPKIQGEFYTIPVIHRDPAELKTTLETMLPDLIRTEADQNQNGQNQGPEQQILRQLMQARGGQQAAEEEQESPKAVLGVDEKGHALLVSGPPFIYQQILIIVQKLDSPELSEGTFVLVPLEGRNGELFAQSLKASLGEKIEYTAPGGSSTSPNANQGQPQANSLGAMQAQQQAAERNAVMQALQQQMNQRNRGGQGQQNRGNRGGGRGGQGGQGQPGGQIPGIQFQRGG